MTAEHCGVSREDCSDVHVTSATYNQSNAGNPLVEMCHHVRRAFHVLLILDPFL